MPGPLIEKPELPTWADPKQASVFDAPGQGTLRKLVGMLGLDDPNQIMNSANPLGMTLAPRASAAELSERLIPKDAPMQIKVAIGHLIERFPRVMSHVASISGANLTPTEEMLKVATGEPARVTMGRAAAIGQSVAPNGLESVAGDPLAVMWYDRRYFAHPTGEELNTMAHEATHVAQNIRQTDRAIRGAGETWNATYTAANRAAGYAENPFEVAARDTAASVVDKKNTIFTLRNVAEKVWDATGGDDVKTWDRLKSVFPNVDDSALMTTMKYLRSK